MIREVGIGVVVQRYLHLWRQVVRQAESVAEAADRLLRSSAIMQSYGWDSEEDQRSAMDVLRGAHDVDDLLKVVQYCKRLAKVGAEWAELYGALATAVFWRYTETSQRGASDPLAVLVDDFLDLQPPARTANRTLHLVLNLALQRTSESGYNAARRLYASVRAVNFAWRHDRYGQWKSMFHAALDHSHNQMASRLYTDALADRLVPGRTECLRLIRSVCGARNASRPVLIERLIRDYVAFHSSDRDKAMLINAVAEGLTEGRSEDAVLALAIIKRLVPADMIPEAIDMRLIACLARVPLQRQRAAMLDILNRAPDTHANLSQLYEVAISSVAKLANLQKGSDLSPSAAVALCTDLYRQRMQRSISPGRRTLSSLIVVLIKNRQLDTALQVFEKASQLHHVRSDVAGRLIIACALSGRLSDAEEVERKWRSGQTVDSYDRGVTGARVLVDTLKGEKVDFELVHRKTGWRPTTAYLLFIQEHIKAQGQLGEQEAEMPESVYQSMRANDAGDVEAGEEDLCDTPHAVSYAC
jgi:hypothetical protein